MKKILNWLRESNRWKHLLGGIMLGLLANGWYCAALVGIATGAAMEYKDRQWGGLMDWSDFALTLGGCMIGFTLKFILL
jgi:hypothetical protein